MIYLDSGATSLHKPPQVAVAMSRALKTCANPGRGGHPYAMEALRIVGACREKAASLFDTTPEQVAFTTNCTQGINIAIETLVKPGSRVLISGFEHNAVTRPLYARGAHVRIAGRKLFDWADTLSSFEAELKRGVDCAVFTHVSNVFGYVLPVERMAELCRQYGVPFVIDAAQSAGTLPVHLGELGADFIAMPGHKGLLGPQGTGLLLCGRLPKPLVYGGTGSLSELMIMPDFLPDRAEAGTLNVPGIAGLDAGLSYLLRTGVQTVGQKEEAQAKRCANALSEMGYTVFTGDHQSGTVSFVPEGDCELYAQALEKQGIAVRAGLHCAPLAHQSAGTFGTGTVRISFGYDACDRQSDFFIKAARFLR